MDIQTAIEAIGEDGLESGQATWGEYLEAIQLGREALEFYKREKASNTSGIWTLLPGETKEGD